MATKILLTPDELKAQAAEMDALRAEYESLFANVSGELRKANGNWSTNMAGNFAGKINSATKSFRNINDLLENGANAAKYCAVSFESIDSELSKLCKGETSFADNMKNAISATGFDLKASVEDVNKIMDYIDEKFDNLTDAEKKVLKDIYRRITKDTPIEDLDSVYKIIDEARKGNIVGSVSEFIDAISSYKTEDGSINFTGLKIKAIGKTLKIVLDEDGYIHKNNEKYMDIMTDRGLQGDIPGVIWYMGGDFVQTVGKGSVDVLCQLGSGLVDTTFAKVTGGTTLSEINAIMYEKYGWSPGHAFNDIAGGISDMVDVVVDEGYDFIKDVAKSAGETIGGVADVVGKTGKVVASTIGDIGSTIGNFLGGLF